MTRFPDCDAISWHPVSTIEKYSPDQVRWLRERLDNAPLAGSVLMRLMHPEDGIVRDEGNGVVAGGSANLALLLTGLGGHALAPGRAVFGVGGDATEFDREHVHLSHTVGEEMGQSWYRPMDHSYPQVPRPGVIEGQATFAETEACFAWHEWCWAAGPLRPEPHHSLRGAYGGASCVMLNRKAHPAGYGTKELGAAWVFRTEITIGG